jgi:Flp pilus assembly protein TadB
MHGIFSPFVVPLGAFAVAIAAIVAGAFNQQQRERLKADQRMAMVARGMNPDDIDKLLTKASTDGRLVKDPLQSLARTRRAAIVLISTGAGLMLFSAVLTWILKVHEVLSAGAAGLIPLAIGVGFLVDYNLQKRDLARFGLEVGRPE